MMAKDPLEKLRLRKDKRSAVRADLIAVVGIKDQSERAAVAVQEFDGGRVYILVPQDALGNFAMAALGAVHQAQQQPVNDRPPIPERRARHIPVDRVQLLHANDADAPAGHVVLELFVGVVPIRFSAPADMFRTALELAARAGTGQRTMQ
jgi:hypothetical protein